MSVRIKADGPSLKEVSQGLLFNVVAKFKGERERNTFKEFLEQNQTKLEINLK